MEKKKILQVPQELIIQILLKLPVKSLIRFKCVCKLWFTLISDPHFANSHFHLSSEAHTRRILFITPDLTTTRSIDVETSLDDDTVSASMNLNFMDPQSYFPISIKNSCRGFLFMHLYSDIYLWNPSTGVHKQIPLSPIDSNLDGKYFCYLYGFGYDQSRDDYLVVLMSYDTTLDTISSYLEFFSLRANTWNQIEGTHFPYMNACDDPRVGLFFKGAIHWLAYRHDLLKNVIVSFDLMERELLYMHFPDEFYTEPTDCDLWVFGEFLSLGVVGDGMVEIWVMKEYKMHSSWTKTLVLSTDSISPRYFYPICSTKSGDIIGRNGGNGLVKYNDKGQLLGYHSFRNDAHGSQAAMYVESLLSLPGGNEQG